jgi:hypothetical protein
MRLKWLECASCRRLSNILCACRGGAQHSSQQTQCLPNFITSSPWWWGACLAGWLIFMSSTWESVWPLPNMDCNNNDHRLPWVVTAHDDDSMEVSTATCSVTFLPLVRPEPGYLVNVLLTPKAMHGGVEGVVILCYRVVTALPVPQCC